MRRHRSAGVLLALAACSVAACGSSGDADLAAPLPIAAAAPATTVARPASTTPTSTAPASAIPTSTSRPASTEPPDAVLAAYDTYWRAYIALMQDPDPQSPAFSTVMTGAQRTWVRDLVQRRLDRNERVRFPPGSITRRTRTVESIAGDRAVVVVCAVDDSYLLDIGTGEVLDDVVQTVLTRVTVERVTGTWTVAHVLVDRIWDGVAGCAA